MHLLNRRAHASQSLHHTAITVWPVRQASEISTPHAKAYLANQALDVVGLGQAPEVPKYLHL
jgi:hypothetical protein